MASRVFVVHTDGITTTGAVYRKFHKAPDELGRAVSTLADPMNALSEVIDTLREAGVKVPAKVHLVSERAVLVRAEFPVHPDRPRPYAQMRELARWESELGFSDLPDWDIGSILQATGVLTAEQDQQIHDEIEQRSQMSLGGPAPRYQDVGLSLGLLDRGKRDIAVAVRERLGQPVGEPGCAWAPVQKEQDSDFAQHPWLLSAVGEFDRELWRNACKANKVTLAGIFPAWGMADYAVQAQTPAPEAETTEQRLLVERHSGAISILHTNGKAVESVRLINTVASARSEEELLNRALERRQRTSLVAVGFDDAARAEIDEIFPGSTHLDDTLSACLKGAAAVGLGVKGALAWMPMVKPTEPKPPIWKSSDFFHVLVLVVLVLGIGGFDLSKRWQKASLDDRLATLDEEFDKKKSLSGMISQANRRITTLEKNIETAEADIVDLIGRKDNATYLQSRRQHVVRGVLQALSQSIPQGVIMREISESKSVPEVFTLSAWALTDIAAEQFISRLNTNLGPLGLVVAGEAVVQATGPQKVVGYNTVLQVAPRGSALTDLEEEQDL